MQHFQLTGQTKIVCIIFMTQIKLLKYVTVEIHFGTLSISWEHPLWELTEL